MYFILYKICTKTWVHIINKYLTLIFMNLKISFLKIFLMWTIFKSLMNFLQYCFSFVFWFFGPETCGIGSPHSCLENPMVRGAWQTPVHGVAKSWTRLKRHSTHTQLHDKGWNPQSLLWKAKS